MSKKKTIILLSAIILFGGGYFWYFLEQHRYKEDVVYTGIDLVIYNYKQEYGALTMEVVTAISSAWYEEGSIAGQESISKQEDSNIRKLASLMDYDHKK